MRIYKVLLLFLTIIVTLGSTACTTKRIDPKEATEILINSIVYQNDVDIKKYKDAFNEDAKVSKKQVEDVFISTVSSSLTSMGIIEGNNDKEIKELWDVTMNRIKKETSYTVKVIKDNNTSPVLEVNIKGLDSDKLMEEFKGELTSRVENDPEIAQDRAKFGKLFLNTFKKAIESANSSENYVTVQVKLERNKDVRYKWSIVDQNKTTSKISTAFFTGK